MESRRERPERGKRRRKTPEEIEQSELLERRSEREESLSNWIPKTELGKKVKAGEITSLEEVFEKNYPILEAEIIDSLTELQEKMIDFSKTTRVTRAGRKFSFRATVIVGNKNGLIGIATAKDVEKWPAVKKAARKAKLSLVKVHRGCGSWECVCGLAHSVPFKVTGKSGSVHINLLPAPKGTGLVVGNNVKDVFKFAGITDVWSNTSGSTDTKLNFARAVIDALSKTSKMKVSNEISKKEEKKQ